MIESVITQVIYLAIAAYAALGALHCAMRLLETACDMLCGLDFPSRRFAASRALKHLILLLVLLKVLEWAAHMTHLW